MLLHQTEVDHLHCIYFLLLSLYNTPIHGEEIIQESAKHVYVTLLLVRFTASGASYRAQNFLLVFLHFQLFSRVYFVLLG